MAAKKNKIAKKKKERPIKKKGLTKPKKNLTKTKKRSIRDLIYTEDGENIKPEVKWGIIIIAILLGLILFTNILRLGLYVYQLLGNDVLIDLDVNNKTYSLTNGQEAEIEIDAVIASNPFCKSSCEIELQDLSEGKSFWSEQSDDFSYSKTLKLKAPEKGEGIKIYRVVLSCKADSSFLCHTTGTPTERFVLITLNYNQSKEEEAKKENIAEKIILTHNMLDNMRIFNDELNKLSSTLKIYGFQINEEDYLIESYNTTLAKIENEWRDYTYDENTANILYSKINESYQQLYSEYNLTINKVNRFNSLINKLNSIDIELIENYSKLTKSDLINEINIVIDYTTSNNNINSKEKAIDIILEKVNDGIISLNNTLINLSAAIDILDLTYCNLSFDCINRTPLVYNKLKDTEYICEELLRINTNQSNNNMTNISKAVFLLNKNASDIYKDSLTTLSKKQNIKTPICNNNIPEISELPHKIILSNITLTRSYNLEEQKRECCLNNSCSSCCPDCDKKELYPVIFIHGHSFINSMSAEYSLNSFTSIQKKLEEDGFVNAGSITLYNLEEEKIWSELNFPLTLKLSYYYDTYYQPDNVLLVQTKSENIDTYSLRINDLINDVLLRTDQEKVVIVAHSMGGLVIRRYIDIFGNDKIDKAILIAVPNHGISEGIAKQCKWTGNKKECDDMASDSIFMRKLINSKTDTEIVNIYGTGCKTEEGDGDGILIAETLENAENHEIKGKCSGVTFLHNEILDINKFPEVYNIIKETLVTNSS